MRLLGVLLCYNDGDFLAEAIENLLENGHALVVWDHGSDDETPAVLDRYDRHLLERKSIPRDFDFYQLYQAMSEHLMADLVNDFDWISWPDQDELLEGPTRQRSYRDSLLEVFESRYDWVRFDNYNFWWTTADDASVRSVARRVRHYCLFPDCAPRIRAWRASATNIRQFNHNPPLGEEHPVRFNLRHYPMRSLAQMERRLAKDRAGLRRGTTNYHYENMAANAGALIIPPEALHEDDGVSELRPEVIFNWRSIYGFGPRA